MRRVFEVRPAVFATIFATVFAALLTSATGGAAQTEGESLTQAQIAVACAIAPMLEVPRAGGLRVVGGQTPVPRELFSMQDLLFINGGSHAGLQLGQRFFVRRPVTFGAPTPVRPRGVDTAGWVRIVAINDTSAVASVDHECSEIATGDYLEPFTAPSLPDGADQVDATGDPDFSVPGRVLFGREETAMGMAGDFMLVDQGTDHGLASGSRLAVFRDLGGGLPMVSVGEAIVVEAAPATSTVRITRTNDPVQGGDLVFRRKP